MREIHELNKTTAISNATNSARPPHKSPLCKGDDLGSEVLAANIYMASALVLDSRAANLN